MNMKKRIFKKLVEVGIIKADVRSIAEHRKSLAQGFMEFVVEEYGFCFPSSLGEGFTLSMTHYFSQNGDLCKDPDMVLFVNHDKQEAESLCFEMSIPPMYEECYKDDVVNINVQNDHHEFLMMWLDNLKAQGHCEGWAG